MTTHTYSFSQPSTSESDTLLIALFLAAVVHAFIFLGITFSIPQSQKTNKQIEITLASTPVKRAPEKAKFLAQDNQVGAGKETKRPEPPKQKIPSQGDSTKKPPAQRKNATKSKPEVKQKIITQKKAEQKIATAKKQAPPAEKKRPKLSMEALQKQIAQLGKKISSSQQNSEKTKIKFVNSVSTHKYVAAQYMKDWENKVENTGNRNYPEVARKKNFSGSLTMDVGINANGSIYSIRISKSSGNQALDDAAKRIVRLSAPFAALPRELLKELDVLVIPRVWKFSDETGVTTR